MARLPYPGPSYVSGVMHQFPERLHHLNIARMLSYASTAISPFYVFSGALLDQLELDPKLRQLTILRVTHRIEAQYTWIQHVALAKVVGVSDEQISSLQQGRVEGRNKRKAQEVLIPPVREDRLHVCGFVLLLISQREHGLCSCCHFGGNLALGIDEHGHGRPIGPKRGPDSKALVEEHW